MLTSSHVVAPWKWPKYYASEWHWLAGVNESHTHYTVELRHSDGMFLTTADLAPASFHHAHRDVAVMHFDPAEQAEALDTLAELGYRPLELPAPAYTSLPGRAEGEKKLLRVDDVGERAPSSTTARPCHYAHYFLFRSAASARVRARGGGHRAA